MISTMKKKKKPVSIEASSGLLKDICMICKFSSQYIQPQAQTSSLHNTGCLFAVIKGSMC